MARDFAKAFYKSRTWLNCRSAYILSVNGLCETCLQKQRITPGKIVHHKKYITPHNIHDPMVTLNHDNLRLDCQDCHNVEHHGNDNSGTVDGLAFDIDGNLIQLDQVLPPINLRPIQPQGTEGGVLSDTRVARRGGVVYRGEMKG